MLLDGVVSTAIDASHEAEYTLKMRIRDKKKDLLIEEIELAPNGEGLCMGIHGWWDGEFYVAD